MDQFIHAHCLRAGRVRVSDFLRALRAAGIDTPRTEVVATLSREFRITNVGHRAWIDGLSLRASVENRLRRFVDDECLRADGLSCKLTAVVRGSGLSRTQVIYQLQNWGFTITTAGGAYVVRGLGLKELEYKHLRKDNQ